MTLYETLIIDDEKNVREALNLLLTKHCPSLHITGMAASAEEGRQILKDFKVDFIFLDISMPGEDGFSFLKSIAGENYGIIFTTAYQEYALNALKANDIEYLLKPIDSGDLCAAVTRTILKHKMRSISTEASNSYANALSNLHSGFSPGNLPNDELVIPQLNGLRIINPADLMYIKEGETHIVIHMKEGEEIACIHSLDKFEKLLNDVQFLRIDKSTIINLACIKSYSSILRTRAVLTDGTQLSIPRLNIARFREAMNSISKKRDLNNG